MTKLRIAYLHTHTLAQDTHIALIEKALATRQHPSVLSSFNMVAKTKQTKSRLVDNDDVTVN